MNIFELFGTIAINNQEANKSIDQTVQKGKRLSKTFQTIGKGALACGKFVAKGMVALGAAGAAGLGMVVKTYADYEQLVGGIETLFKGAEDQMMAYAKKAYKTAGMSATAYMETATSFAASLVSALGGDTAAAAEMSNMAITDMADNANKMGSDIGMIQNAYQGFAKQNYTMLDNLKLGYGGTQTEMARLINDSGVMGDSFVATAENINDVSFAKIIEAIHVIQSEMGIAGTTAAEAEDTIAGSFSSFKATWTNLLTGMASEDNIEPLIDAFFGAGGKVLKNVGKILPRVWNNVQTGFVKVGQKIREVMGGTIWPAIQKFAKVNFGIELPEWASVEQAVADWWTAMKSGVKSICSWTLQLFGMPEESADEIGSKVQTWWDTAKQTVGNICKWAIKILGPEPWTDEDTKEVQEWWAGAWAAIKDMMTVVIDFLLTPFSVVANEIKTVWFPKLLNSIGRLAIPITATLTNVMRPVAHGVGALTGQTPEQIDQALDGMNQTAQDLVTNPSKVVEDLDFSLKDAFDAMGFATGLDFVPRNNFPALLHYGETVLTREDASAWRSGQAGSTAALAARLEAALSQLTAIAQDIAANTAAGRQVVLDTGVLVGQLTPGMDARLGILAARKGRRG